MANIIDLPDFMFNYTDRKKYSKIGKIFLFIKGLIVGFFYKTTNQKTFTLLMNIFFRKDGKILFNDGYYYKELDLGHLIYYPNKRIDRVIVDHQKHFHMMFETYCLDKITFQNNDLIIDCGANVGELYFSFLYRNLAIKYIAFEPDKFVFKSLKKNISIHDQQIFNIALSDKENTETFYSDSYGANSSLVKFDSYSDKYSVKTKTIDSFNFEKIKLLKLESEGYELEILEGSKKTLNNIEYISVDYGPERGINSELTIADVTNFLYENNFKLIDGSKFRYIGLFKNSNL